MPVKPSENPFRSARVDALAYRLTGLGVSVSAGLEHLEPRLRQTQFRGAIVGPHGHGKSTLMRQLLKLQTPPDIGQPFFIQVKADGSNTVQVREHLKRPTGLLLLDGYDLMSVRMRSALWRRRHVVVTSHFKTALPTLHRCETSAALLGELIGELSPATRQSMDEGQLAALFDKHQGNLRDALREMYDRAASL